MEELAIYLLKSALCTAVFLGIYWCFFKNETFYRFNRHFLLIGLICSVLLPFYTYTYNVNISAPNTFAGNDGALQQTPESGSVWFYVLLFAYAGGVCFLLMRHIAGLGRIKRMIGKYGYTVLQGCKLVTTPVFKSSFSVFNYIIIDSSSNTSEIERKLILEHELAHVKQFHWVDLLLSQVFCALQWFNPFAWLYLHVIKQNHEFLADQAVLQQGNSVAVYRAALINHSLGTVVFTLASSFSQIDKLKRINMMVKPASGSLRKFAVMIALPALAVFFWAFAKPEFTVLQVAETERADVVVADTLRKGKAVVQPKKQVSAPVKVKKVLKKQDKIIPVQQPILVQEDKSRDIHQPLMYLDGVEVNSMNSIPSEDIESINVLKEGAAVAAYGEKGRYGVILIYSKKVK